MVIGDWFLVIGGFFHVSALENLRIISLIKAAMTGIAADFRQHEQEKASNTGISADFRQREQEKSSNNQPLTPNP
ncbi:MAG: hypothetical protein WCO02_07355 [Bacteroidota bacterium]